MPVARSLVDYVPDWADLALVRDFLHLQGTLAVGLRADACLRRRSLENQLYDIRLFIVCERHELQASGRDCKHPLS